MFTYLVQTVNNMYQNVSGKSIENQELILRVFFAVRVVVHGRTQPWVDFYLKVTFHDVSKIMYYVIITNVRVYILIC